MLRLTNPPKRPTSETRGHPSWILKFDWGRLCVARHSSHSLTCCCWHVLLEPVSSPRPLCTSSRPTPGTSQGICGKSGKVGKLRVACCRLPPPYPIYPNYPIYPCPARGLTVRASAPGAARTPGCAGLVGLDRTLALALTQL